MSDEHISDEMKMGGFFGDLGGKVAGNFASNFWDNLDIDGVKGKDKDVIVPAATKAGSGLAMLGTSVDYAEVQKHGTDLFNAFKELGEGLKVPTGPQDAGTIFRNLGTMAGNVVDFSVKAAPAAVGLQNAIHMEPLNEGVKQVKEGSAALFEYIKNVQANFKKGK